MSIHHMQMVFDADGLSPREKCILLAYCNYTDPHGYVWAGVPRVSDDTGASESTVKRVRKDLQSRGLLATKRRVDPRSGRSTSNITRINLDRLSSMKRVRREYDDNVIEELGFEDESPDPKNPSDLRIGQIDPGADLRIGQSDPAPGLNLTSPEGQVNLTPNPSDEPSGSSSSGDSGGTPTPRSPLEEEEESPSASKRGVRPQDLVLEATDATTEEAQALVEALRPEATKSLGGFIRTLGSRGDLEHRLWLLRRERASEARTQASAASPRGVCSLHGIQGACPACRDDLHDGGALAQSVKDMFQNLGPDRACLRPDLAQHPALAPAAT